VQPQRVFNTGYDIRFTYVSDVWTDSSVGWYQLKTAAIYKTSTATQLDKFTYTISGAETTVTDLAARAWKYSGYQNTPSVLPVTAVTSNFTLKLPTNTFTTVSTTRYASGTSQGLVNTVSRNGLTYTYTYSGVQSIGSGKIFTGLTITGPLGYQRILTYGAWGQGYAKQPYVISDTNSLGKTTSFTYVGRRIQTITYPEGNKVTYTYDDKGNVLQKRATKKPGASNPDIVNSATYLYCPSGGSSTVRCFKPLTITDGNNKITKYTFADHGGLLEAEGPAASNGYKRVTRNVWVQASGSGLWRLDNTKECFLVECGYSSSNVRITSYTYWGATNLPLTVTTKSSASGLNSVVTYSYDNAGRVLYVDGPLSGLNDAVYSRYDAAGRQTWEIGAVNDDTKRIAKRLTLRVQDSQPTKIETGSIISASDTVLAVDTIQNITYTTHGLPTTIKTLGGATTYQFKQITYDTRNRVSCEAQRMNTQTFASPPASACSLGTAGIYGSDRITKYDYDNQSHTTKVTSGFGTTDAGIDRQTTYTNNGQVSTLADGNGNTTTYLYDGHDRLNRVNFPNATYELFGYDGNGNKTSWRKRDGTTFTYQYDVTNQLKTTLVPSESSINYIYDGVGRPKEVNRGTSNKTEYGYDDRGFLSSYKTNGSQITYVNDAAGRRTSMTYPAGQIVTYAYDSSGAVTDIDARQSAGTSLLAIADYNYNNMGRLTSVALSGGATTTYLYGAIGRLSNHTLTNFNTTTFAYNPASQMVMRTVTSATKQTLLPTTTPTAYVINNLNQYSSAGGMALSYNTNGNLTAYKGWTYAYDAHNRLTTASKTGTSVALGYDPSGNLISNSLNSAITKYVYSGDQLIGEYTSAGTPINLYIYPPNSDIPIARFSGSSGLTDVKYLRSDERGSIVAETVGTTAVESHQYDVYGVPSNTSTSLFRYTGQIQLKGTELYHYKARAYHPGLGRFLQTDPIGYDDGMNMYAYVGNDPVNGTDPTGMLCEGTGEKSKCTIDQVNIGSRKESNWVSREEGIKSGRITEKQLGKLEGNITKSYVAAQKLGSDTVTIKGTGDVKDISVSGNQIAGALGKATLRADNQKFFDRPAANAATSPSNQTITFNSKGLGLSNYAQMRTTAHEGMHLLNGTKAWNDNSKYRFEHQGPFGSAAEDVLSYSGYEQ